MYITYKYFTPIIFLLFLCFVESETKEERVTIKKWEQATVENGFNNWRNVTNDPSNYDQYLDVFFLKDKPNLGWACGFHSKVLKTTDGGVTWTGVLIDNQNNHLETIQFLNEKVGYCSGPGSNNGVLYKTTDGGESWYELTPNLIEDNKYVPMWGCHFIDEDNGLLLAGSSCSNGDMTNLYFLKTTNGGSSWKSANVNYSNSKMSDPLIIEKGGLAFAVSAGMIWRSSDGGTKWEKFLKTTGQDWHEELSYFNGSFFIPSSNGCHGDDTQGSGSLSFYKDGEWKVKRDLPAMYGTFLLSETEGYGVGFDQAVYFTEDAGEKWTLINNCIEFGDMDDIFFLNKDKGYIVGDGVYYLTEKEVVANVESEELYFCENEYFEREIDLGDMIYQWRDESGKILGVSSYLNLLVSESRNIILEVKNSNCPDTIYQYKYDLNLYDNPIEFEFSQEGDFCEGEEIVINTSRTFGFYNWENSSNSNSYRLDSSAIINLTVLDEETGCYFSKGIEIEFHELPSPEINPKTELSVCYGFDMILESKYEHSVYNWYLDDDNNIYSTDRRVDIKEKGIHNIKLVVENENGCESTSDEVEIEIRDQENQIFYNTELKGRNIDYKLTTIGDVDCKALVLKNTSDELLEIKTPFLVFNIDFSIPDYQLPLRIAPGEDEELMICFSPNKLGENRDTLIFNDLCSRMEIDLMGFSNTSIYNSDTQCDIDIMISQGNTFNSYYSDLSNPYPQPTNKELKIDFIYFIENNKDFNESARVYNLLGEEVGEFEKVIDLEKKNDNGIFYIGKYIINVSEFSTGIYILKIENRQTPKTFNIQIDD